MSSTSILLSMSPLIESFDPPLLIASTPGEELHLIRSGSLSMQCCEIKIAQNFDQDVLGDISRGVTHFFQSGQAWAFLLGLVLGYMLKSITSSN